MIRCPSEFQLEKFSAWNCAHRQFLQTIFVAFATVVRAFLHSCDDLESPCAVVAYIIMGEWCSRILCAKSMVKSELSFMQIGCDLLPKFYQFPPCIILHPSKKSNATRLWSLISTCLWVYIHCVIGIIWKLDYLSFHWYFKTVEI